MCPVIRCRTRVQVADASIKAFHLWPLFSMWQLTQPVCNADDPEFANFVDNIGYGAGPNVQLVSMLCTLQTSSSILSTLLIFYLIPPPPWNVQFSLQLTFKWIAIMTPFFIEWRVRNGHTIWQILWKKSMMWVSHHQTGFLTTYPNIHHLVSHITN
jgi:hypothetical protein